MPMPNAVVATTTSSVAVHEALLDVVALVRAASPRGTPRRAARRAQRVGQRLGLAPRRDVDDPRRRGGGDPRLAARAACAPRPARRGSARPRSAGSGGRTRGSAPPASRSPSRSTISSRTGGAAVAVSASTGGRPSASIAAPEPQVLRPEVVSPLGDAVRLVDHEQRDVGHRELVQHRRAWRAARARGTGTRARPRPARASACSRSPRADRRVQLRRAARARPRAAPRPGRAAARSAARRRRSRPGVSSPAIW